MRVIRNRTGRVKRGFRHRDRTPIHFASIWVDDVRYDIQYHKRYGSEMWVLSCPELGGVGPAYSMMFEDAEAQLKEMIRRRLEGETGWTESPIYYDTDKQRWKVRHGYGDSDLTPRKKRGPQGGCKYGKE